MKKNYIIGLVMCIAIVALFVFSIDVSDKRSEEVMKNSMPAIGQKLWTYNMNKHEWRKYQENDNDTSKEEIILQVQEPEGNGGYTSYNLLTGNKQVPHEDVWIGEGSEEFLSGKKLYSYYPKNFEFYEIVFNGVKFVPRELSLKEIKDLSKGYSIIKVSALKKHPVLNLKYSKLKNKFMIVNDGDENFYKYYIVPNDNKKMKIDRFSNQFKVSEDVNIRIQRLEGCSKAYPCYDIRVHK